jgi:hypothetical protein
LRDDKSLRKVVMARVPVSATESDRAMKCCGRADRACPDTKASES